MLTQRFHGHALADDGVPALTIIFEALQFQLDRLTSLNSVEQKAKTLGFERTDPRQVVMVESVAPTLLSVPAQTRVSVPHKKP